MKDAVVVPGSLGSSFSRNHCASTFGHQPSSAGGCSGVQISKSKFWSEAGSAARNFWYQCRTAADPGGPGTTSSCNHTINAGQGGAGSAIPGRSTPARGASIEATRRHISQCIDPICCACHWTRYSVHIDTGPVQARVGEFNQFAVARSYGWIWKSF